MDSLHEERLRVSPFFHTASDPSGRPYVAQETEPYTQYWLTDRYRLLLSMFSGRLGATASEGIDAYLRCAATDEGERRRLETAMAKMRAAGILVGPGDDTSRYDASVVDDYLKHRPIPAAVARHIIREGRIRKGRRVLDLAGGPGELAVTMAKTTADVTLMEISRAFLKSSRARAKARRVSLSLLNDSANRLLFREEKYDVVTVSRALHWLDDVAVCRGMYRVLSAGGSFFVVEVRAEVPDRHPLAIALGKEAPFRKTVAALSRRLDLLFRALDTKDVIRLDFGQPADAEQGETIEPVGVWEFQDHRSLPLGYARSFFTQQHVAEQVADQGGDEASFWEDLRARYAAASPKEIMGTERWAVLHFRRRSPATGAKRGRG
jgi:2-polyprenyl-3-methyl-5-hydroxy-6-metoxy-1,4-benzoquinol methylase